MKFFTIVSIHIVLVIIAVGSLSLFSQTSIQIGSDIDGENDYDYSGYSISMPDTNTLAIGAPWNSGNGTNSGHVRVYSRNGSMWAQKGADIDGEVAGDQLGRFVSMPDSNTLAIGAPYNDGNGTNAGHVRVYSWSGSVWIQKGADINGEAANDQSGSSVCMPDSNNLAIGAIYNSANGSGSGHVRVYSWNGNLWIQKGLDIDGEAAGDGSGWSISMPDSNTLAIGAVYNGGNGTLAGQVRVYYWNGSIWVQKGGDIDGEAAFDISGNSVSMPDSNTLAIGARFNAGNGTKAGHVRVYYWSGIEWLQKGLDIDGEAAGDESGYSVSMPNANVLAIGAPNNDGNVTDAGQVRIYGWKDSLWVQQITDIDGEAFYYNNSGWSVSMPDSNMVSIGAYWNSGNGILTGHARVYSLCYYTTSTFSTSSCINYISPSGKYTWTNSGTYVDTIPNYAGCDSIISIHLTINTVNDSVNNNSPTLTANLSGASYQWIDCNNGNMAINGANGQSYTATSNGSYAVVIMQNSCTDTSDCIEVTNLSIIRNSFEETINIYPNPIKSKIFIEFESNNNVQIKLRTATGQVIQTSLLSNSDRLELSIKNLPGFYFLEFTDQENNKAIFKIIKE
jgi:hypothetical protein